jgi:hypothetical protein
MPQKFHFEDKEYVFDDLGDNAKSTINLLQFVNRRVKELNNMQALLQCAKNSYVNSLKQEMLSEKAGLLLGEE